jgi:hypothetical protein
MRSSSRALARASRSRGSETPDSHKVTQSPSRTFNLVTCQRLRCRVYPEPRRRTRTPPWLCPLSRPPGVEGASQNGAPVGVASGEPASRHVSSRQRAERRGALGPCRAQRQHSRLGTRIRGGFAPSRLAARSPGATRSPLRLAKDRAEILASVANTPGVCPAIYGSRRRTRTPLALCPLPVLPEWKGRLPRDPSGGLVGEPALASVSSRQRAERKSARPLSSFSLAPLAPSAHLATRHTARRIPEATALWVKIP